MVLEFQWHVLRDILWLEMTWSRAKRVLSIYSGIVQAVSKVSPSIAVNHLIAFRHNLRHNLRHNCQFVTRKTNYFSDKCTGLPQVSYLTTSIQFPVDYATPVTVTCDPESNAELRGDSVIVCIVDTEYTFAEKPKCNELGKNLCLIFQAPCLSDIYIIICTMCIAHCTKWDNISINSLILRKVLRAASRKQIRQYHNIPGLQRKSSVHWMHHGTHHHRW